jgi:hypothetical protein
MRAPPEAVTRINGIRASNARSTARQIFSPTTEPMLPPMNPKSNTHNATLRPLTAPWPMTMASFRPVFSCCDLMRSL